MRPVAMRSGGSWSAAKGGSAMRTYVFPAIFSVVVLALPAPAAAKGCIKGALVGGVAGHYAGHHGVLGAAAGCVIGRHEAKKQARERSGNGYQ
jgi:hypothetical protein